MNPVQLCRRPSIMLICCMAMAAGEPKGHIKPEMVHDFDCYIQSAEARMNARKTFLLAEADPGGRISLVTPNGANPHKLTLGQLYDLVGTVFIQGASLDRLIALLQDYDHRAAYFPEMLSTSRLLCRSGKDHFRYSMRLKDPAVIDVESDVVWERLDAEHWRLRSYSTKVQEVGKDHGYLRRLYSYWRFAGTEKGVYVEGENITLSDEFGSMARAFGSVMLGINPEKSLKHSLSSMRDAVLKPGLQIPNLPEAIAVCSAPVQPGSCAAEN